MDDLQRLHPKNVTMGEARFSGRLTRTKCSGPGKNVRELFLLVPASLGVAVADWLRKWYELCRKSALFPRDYFFPRVSSDLSTFVPKLASTNDLSGMLNVVVKMLKVPVRDGDSGEVVESGVGFLSADFTTGWTGHSERSAVTCILAAVGFTKEDAAYLGRWASQVLQKNT